MTINVTFAVNDLDYIAKLNTMVSQTNSELAANLLASQAQAASAAASAGEADADRISAETAKTDAEAAWTAALAANPDLNPAVRMNPSTITTNLSIPAGYNAFSAGPLTIRDDIDVTVSDDANWIIF